MQKNKILQQVFPSALFLDPKRTLSDELEGVAHYGVSARCGHEKGKNHQCAWSTLLLRLSTCSLQILEEWCTPRASSPLSHYSLGSLFSLSQVSDQQVQQPTRCFTMSLCLQCTVCNAVRRQLSRLHLHEILLFAMCVTPIPYLGKQLSFGFMLLHFFVLCGWILTSGHLLMVPWQHVYGAGFHSASVKQNMTTFYLCTQAISS